MGRNGVVSSAHILASQAGLKVLKKGGNAVDSVVATALALGVVAPAFSGIGGGGFLLVHLTKTGESLYVDYREVAPKRARPDMFKPDADGEAVDFENSIGYKAVGVPGSIAGLTFALENYGTMKFRDVASYAIEYGRKGFEISKLLGYIMANNVDNATEKFRRYKETGKVWLNGGTRPFRVGETKVNKEFADVLELVSKDGKDAFYHRKVAKILSEDMAKNGGLVTEDDLAKFSVKVRKPVTGTYRDYEVHAMPPPSLGGAAIVQMLNMFENVDLGGMGHNTPETIAVMAKAMGLAYSSLKKEIGDPDFAEVPLAKLISKEFARKLWSGSTERGTGDTTKKNWTTHMSVIDKERNVGAITESLECFFGSGVTPPGTGFCLNDTMHDFDVAPGNLNSIAPGKKPRSNMTPTLILKEGEPVLVAGSAGGPRIVTATLQTILNALDHGMEIEDAVNAPRIHYQGSGSIKTESCVPASVRKSLNEMGFETEIPHVVQLTPGYDLYFGGVHAIMAGKKKGELRGAADKRRLGGVAAY